MKKIKNFFEHLYNYYGKDYISTDPIIFPHTYGGNIEFIGFTSAMFAYGNVPAMQKFLHSLFRQTGTDPFVMNTHNKTLKYRFQSVQDVEQYLLIMRRIYEEYGSLQSFFYQSDNIIENTKNAFIKIHEHYMKEKTHGLKFLFSIPEKSASKRLHMFLRWMIRKDEVDFGLWNYYDKSRLSMPMDTHIKALSLNLGIINNSDANVNALNKINSYFKDLNREDPTKYDFALTRLGIIRKCKYCRTNICIACIHNAHCVFN